MSDSINGTRDNSFRTHNPSQVNVTFKKGLSPIQLLGFSNDDEAIMIEQDNDSLSYTKGLYGATTANISLDDAGTVTLKFLGSSEDNKRFAEWHNEMKSGNVVPADIIVTGIDFKDSALKCLPVKIPPMPRSSKEDPVIVWVLKAASVKLAESIS
jgi:hypothetical protein